MSYNIGHKNAFWGSRTVDEAGWELHFGGNQSFVLLWFIFKCGPVIPKSFHSSRFIYCSRLKRSLLLARTTTTTVVELAAAWAPADLFKGQWEVPYLHSKCPPPFGKEDIFVVSANHPTNHMDACVETDTHKKETIFQSTVITKHHSWKLHTT